MNRKDIMRMADKSHLDVYGLGTNYAKFADALERFAALVASAEREECKKLCTWKTGNQFVDEAVAVCYRAIDQRGQE
jgi:hypothetical protein